MPGRSHWAVQRRHTLTPGLTWIRRDLPRPEVDQVGNRADLSLVTSSDLVTIQYIYNYEFYNTLCN
jgi:hypothetical protein